MPRSVNALRRSGTARSKTFHLWFSRLLTAWNRTVVLVAPDFTLALASARSTAVPASSPRLACLRVCIGANQPGHLPVLHDRCATGSGRRTLWLILICRPEFEICQSNRFRLPLFIAGLCRGIRHVNHIPLLVGMPQFRIRYAP